MSPSLWIQPGAPRVQRHRHQVARFVEELHKPIADSLLILGFGVPYFNTFFLKGTLMK